MTRLGIALVALVLSGCGVSTSEGATRIRDDAVPYDLLDGDAGAVVPQASGRSVTLCLLRDDLLAPVQRRLAQGADLTDIARSLAEVTDSEAAAGLGTSLGAEEEIRSVRRQAGVAAVDLAPEASQRLTADPLATVAQVVCTLTAQPGIGLVRFSVDEVPVEVPRADGSLSEGPVSEDDYASMYPPR